MRPQETLRLLRLQTADFDTSLADKTVELRRIARSKSLSLADRACLALAMREKSRRRYRRAHLGRPRSGLQGRNHTLKADSRQ